MIEDIPHDDDLASDYVKARRKLDKVETEYRSVKAKYDLEIMKIKEDMARLEKQIVQESSEDGVDFSAYGISVSYNKPKPIVQDEDKLPDRFVKTKKEPDKKAINEAIKNGLEVSGVAMDNGSYTVRYTGVK